MKHAFLHIVLLLFPENFQEKWVEKVSSLSRHTVHAPDFVFLDRFTQISVHCVDSVRKVAGSVFAQEGDPKGSSSHPEIPAQHLK